MPLDLVRPIIREYNPQSPRHYAELPARRPSTQPSAGSGSLRASLGGYISHGHSSMVFALKDVTIQNVPLEVAPPPLVVKIARLNRVTSLMREAWFYDEMECLQGASIPRCYGYFEMELHEDSTKAALEHLAMKYPSSDSRDINFVLEREMMRGPLHPLLDDRSRRKDVVAVLVLEKLGLPLPLGQSVPQETQSVHIHTAVEVRGAVTNCYLLGMTSKAYSKTWDIFAYLVRVYSLPLNN